MLLCLIFGTTCLLFISYYFSEKDILSPWVIINGVFLISEIFFALNYSKWEAYDFSIDTPLIILFSLFLWGIGSILGIFTTSKQNQYSSKNFPNKFFSDEIEPLNIVIFILIAFTLATFAIYFKETYNMSVAAGNTEGLAQLTNYAKIAQRKYNMAVGRLAQHMYMCSRAISNICILALFYNISLKGFKIKYSIFIIPVIIYLLLCALTGGRYPYIVFFAYSFILGMTIIRKAHHSFNRDAFKIIAYAISILLLFFLIFIVLGIWGKNFGRFSIFDYLGIYTGSSIYALDKYIHNPIPANTFWGSETLIPIYAVLGKFGIPTPDLYSPLENVTFNNGYYTNVYTSLRRYLQDYGYIGTYMIQFFLGYLYSKLYCKIKYLKKLDFKVVLYSMIISPLVMYSIEERFFLNIFSLSMFYEIVYTIFIYYILFGIRIRKGKLYRTITKRT